MSDPEHAEWQHLLKTTMEPKTLADGASRIVSSQFEWCAGSGS